MTELFYSPKNSWQNARSGSGYQDVPFPVLMTGCSRAPGCGYPYIRNIRNFFRFSKVAKKNSQFLENFMERFRSFAFRRIVSTLFGTKKELPNDNSSLFYISLHISFRRFDNCRTPFWQFRGQGLMQLRLHRENSPRYTASKHLRKTEVCRFRNTSYSRDG